MLRLAFLALCLTAPAMAAAQSVDPWVARAAARYRAQGNSSTSLRIRDARGEGRTLTLDIELLPAAAALLEPDNVLSIFSASICADAEEARFFSEGRRLRVDVVRAGRRLGTASTDRCPGAIGQGLSAATFAGGLQSFIGTEEGGVRVTGVRADGNALVIGLDVLPGSAVSQDGAANNFIGGFCSRGDANRSFFDHGLTLRIETTVNGRGSPAIRMLARCP